MFSKKKKKVCLPSKYFDLLKYVSPSPDQHQGIWGEESYVNSGSCHYMACTGAMELIMNKEKGISGHQPGGENDLSERWMMNIKVPKSMKNKNYNWVSDRCLVYNGYGRSMLEKDYPYAKGFHNGLFNVNYNWKDDLPEDWEKKSVPVPKIKRKVLFKKSSVFDVGVLKEKHIDRIKEALVHYDAPVLVVYNGEEIWHSVLIVGYDDDESIEGGWGGCPYVNQMIQCKELREENVKKVKKAIKKQGFREKGVFYVRESEYYKYPKGFYGKSEYLYDYGLKDIENKDYHWQPYVAPYCKRSYDWMKFLGNHAIVIYPDPNQNREE